MGMTRRNFLAASGMALASPSVLTGLAEQEQTEELRLLHLIARKVGVEEEGDPEIAVLEQATDPKILVG